MPAACVLTPAVRIDWTAGVSVLRSIINVKQINEKTLMKRKKIPVFGHPGGGFDFDNTMALW